jgi:hypothetical protein
MIEAKDFVGALKDRVIVRCQHERHASIAKRGDRIENRPRCRIVELRGRLVGHDDPNPRTEHLCDRRTLLLAT